MVPTLVGFHEDSMSVLEAAEAHQYPHFLVRLVLNTQVACISQPLGNAM